MQLFNSNNQDIPNRSQFFRKPNKNFTIKQFTTSTTVCSNADKTSAKRPGADYSTICWTENIPNTTARTNSAVSPNFFNNTVSFSTSSCCYQSPAVSGVAASSPQNSLNLLNANNFQAFDAQFGGSVPTNPGASQLSRSIFTQPGTSLLQGGDVLVSPQNNFKTTPIQSGQVFQSASSPSSQTVSQFTSQVL